MDIKNIVVDEVKKDGRGWTLYGYVDLIDTRGTDQRLAFTFDSRSNFFPLGLYSVGGGDVEYNDVYLSDDAPDSELGYIALGTSLYLCDADLNELEVTVTAHLRERIATAEHNAQEAFERTLLDDLGITI